MPRRERTRTYVTKGKRKTNAVLRRLYEEKQLKNEVFFNTSFLL